jgi:hypothetical protein
MRRVRQRIVEPMFGNLLQHYELQRVGTKGRTAAHKSILISATAYILKKLLKHQPKRVVNLAIHPRYSCLNALLSFISAKNPLGFFYLLAYKSVK